MLVSASAQRVLGTSHHINRTLITSRAISAAAKQLSTISVSLPCVTDLRFLGVRQPVLPQRTGVRKGYRFHATATMASQDLEVFGKAASGSGSPSTVRGDCPFSQRTYMDLEEKKLKYKSTYIEEGDDKPDWFMKNNPSGLIPVLKHGDMWLQDSDKIADYLEEKYPEPALKTPSEYKQIGAGIFEKFTQWLQAKDANSSAKGAFEKELKALDADLKKNGPYIAGSKFTESDCALAPKLFHARVALDHYYGFKFPSELNAVHEYMQKVESRDSFKNTSYPEKMIVEGWQKKFELPGKMVPQAA